MGVHLHDKSILEPEKANGSQWEKKKFEDIRMGRSAESGRVQLCHSQIMPEEFEVICHIIINNNVVVCFSCFSSKMLDHRCALLLHMTSPFTHRMY